MHFEGDAFISYAHLDNVELVEGHRGWVSNLHRALEIRVAQLLGKEPRIWRDPKLQGNDHFEQTLIERLQRVAALVAIISPRYIKSEWTRKELGEFWKAAKQQGGTGLRDKTRIFKVLKTPVPLETHPPELAPLLGYEFFKIDPDTGRIHELDEVFGPEAQREFWLKLDDLAHDICCVLEMLERTDQAGAPSAISTGEAIFLAETTSDLREQRDAIRRDLQQHGYIVLPDRALPSIASELKAAVREDLSSCQLSIHLFGKNYSLVPEGEMDSVLEIQNDLAIERGEKNDFFRFLWIPAGLQVADERQRKVLEHLRTDPRVLHGADLLETFLEDLRTAIHGRLQQNRDKTDHATADSKPSAGKHARVYLIYDQQDAEGSFAWADFLFEQGFEVIRPVFEGDSAEIRDYHDENLRACDAALILYGSANECWLRRKLRELQKSFGYGRTKPVPLVGVALVPPRTLDKERFRTHEAMVISQLEGFSPDPLRGFVSSLQV